MNYKLQGNTIHIVIDEFFEGYTVDSFLDFFKISSKKRFIYKNNIQLNKQPVLFDTYLKIKDVITINFLSESRDFKESSNYPNIVYEDDFMLIVSKEVNKLVYNDNKENNYDTLNNDVSYYYMLSNVDVPIRPIHRLDFETKGLVMYSKIPFFQSYLDYLLSEKQIKRYYKAIVRGKVNFNNITIDKPIGKNRHLNNRYMVSKTGKESITKVKTVYKNKSYSLLELDLLTGRTHQIRVHLSNIGFPILNDKFYSDYNDGLDMHLHAYKIIFKHILTNEIIEVVDSNYDLEELYKEVYDL